MKSGEENGQIKIYPEIPGDWKYYLNFRKADEGIWECEGFFDPVGHE